MEIFKDIKGYEGIYQISNLGRVKSLKRIVNNHSGYKKILKEKFLKQNISKTGYLVVTFQVNCIKKTFKTHRLIADSFLDKIPNKEYINHINGIKTDNRITNLEWCTIQENNIHSRFLGLTNDIGYNSVCSKLTEEQVVFITNSKIPLKKLAIIFNVGFTTIYKAKKRITYKNVPF